MQMALNYPIYILVSIIYIGLCQQECPGGKIEEMDENCELIRGDLIITKLNTFDLQDMSSKMASIKTIEGTLHLKENSFDEFTVLPNLERIESRGSNAAVIFEENKGLRVIDMPSLKHVESEERESDWKPVEFIRDEILQKAYDDKNCLNSLIKIGFLFRGQKDTVCHKDFFTHNMRKKHEGLEVRVSVVVVGCLLAAITIFNIYACYKLKCKSNKDDDDSTGSLEKTEEGTSPAKSLPSRTPKKQKQPHI